MRECAVVENWCQITPRNCFFALTWSVLLMTLDMCKKLCATVPLLEIGVKTFCATVVGLKFVPCVKKLKIKQNIACNSNFTLIGFLDQKRAVIFK